MKKTFNSAFSSSYSQYIFFLIIIYLSYYLKFKSFGLYEDDYYCIGVPANSDFHSIMKIVIANFLDLKYNMGRFIGFTIIFILPWLAYKAGGLISVYIFGILIVFINSILINKILNFKFSPYISLLGTLCFIFFPADTTKSLLIHIYQLQLSLLFILLAFHFYLKNKYFVAYIFAIISLLTYENAFLAFIFIPFYKNQNWNWKLIKKWIFHITVIGICMGILFLIRKFSGEERVAKLELGTSIKHLIGSLILGPPVAIYSYINSVIISLKNLEKILFPVIAGIIIILPVLIIMLKSHKITFSSNEKTYSIKLFKFNISLETEVYQSIKLALTGILMLIVGYLFAFTHYPPTTLAGRSTSVHFGAYIGITILLASILNLCFYYIKKNLPVKILTVLLAVYFSMLIGFGNVIQNDFQLSWNNQKKFWNDIIHKTGKINDGNIILVNGENIPETKYIYTYSWAVPDILNLLYKYPQGWEKPKLAIIGNHCSTIKRDNISQKLYITPMYSWLFEDQKNYYFDEEKLIFFNYDSSGLVRKTGDFYFQNIPLSLKKYDSTAIEFSSLEKKEIAKYFNLEKY